MKNAYDPNSERMVFRFNRLGFGLRYSPSILITALYFVLMHDNEKDSEEIVQLKRCLFECSYMDNLAFTTNSEASGWFGYENTIKIFEKYCNF